MKRYIGLVSFFIANLIGVYPTLTASPLLLPPPTLSPLSDVCENTKSFTLTNGTPVGGFYSGTGVIGNTFDPAKAGVGTHTITYTVYTAGVPSSVTTTIKVNAKPKPEISGTFASCSDSFKSTQYPEHDFYSCSVSSGGPQGSSTSRSRSVCANTVGIYATPANSGSTYKWIVGGGTVSTGQNTSNVTVLWGAPGSGTMQVIETNSSGCTDTVGLCITIVELPVANFSGTTSCLGIANQFTDLSTGAKSWLWDFGDGTTSTEKNPSHIFGSCGNHTVSLTVTTKCGCPSTITKSISVNCSPGPKIICPSTVCSGTKASPYSTDAVCSTYNWSVTGGTITGGLNTPNIVVDWGAGPVGTITLSTSGCTPANCTTPTTVNIPILPANPVISGSATPCQWSTGTYSLPAFPGGVYNWSIVPSTAGTITSGIGSNQISIQWKGPANAQLNVTVGNPFIGCSASANIPISVLPQFSSYTSSQVCKGSTSTVNTSPTGAFNWSLSGGGTIVSGQGTGSLSVNWTTAGTHTITTTPVTAGLYCNSSSTTTATVIETPPVDSISGQKYICPGSTYNYTAWPQNSSMVYKWTVVNGTASPTTGNPTSVTWGASGPYSISVTQEPSYPACASSPVTLPINNINSTSPSISGPPTACVNGTYSYTLPNLPGASYTWSLNPSSAGSVVSGQGSSNVQILYNTAGSATVNVSINLCGSPVNITLSVLVNPAPTPTITTTGNLCPGSTVTLTSSPAFSSYEWKDGAMTVLGTSQSISVAVSATAKPYVLTVTNSNGCQGKTISNIVAASVPKADISTPDKKKYCTGETINSTLYAQSGPGYTYQWYLNGSPAGTGSSIVATAVGSYYVVVTNTDGCTNTSTIITITKGSCSGPGTSPTCIPLPICGMPPCVPPPSGCIPKDSIAIDFFGNGSSWLKQKPTTGGNGKFPDVGASVMSVSGNNNEGIIMPLTTKVFCNNLINFSDNSPIPTIAWYWDFGDGASSTLQNPPHTYAKAGYYYVEFWAQFTSSAYGKTAKSIEIPAVADFESKVNCGTATFSDLSTHTPTSPITAWAWDFGDASTSTAQNPTHNYAAPGTYNVSLTVTAGGCTSVINKNVVVDPFPLAQFTFPSGCAGSPTPFTDASTAVGSSIIFWDWDFGDGTSSQLQNPTHTYTSNGTYTVTLKITDINGCLNTKSQSITITTPSGVGTIATSGPTTFCSDNTVTLTAPTATSYLWSTGSTLQSITVNQSGTYSVSTSSSTGCQATPPPVTVKVNPIPDNSTSSSQSAVCGSGNFYSSVVSTGVGKTYQWFNAGGAISGKTSSFFSTTSAGTYYVIITDASSGCTASSTPVTATFVPGLANGTLTGPSSLCPKTNITLTASATGGTLPYTYSWASGESTPSINISSPAYYYLTITDKNGCKLYPGKTITENPLPDLSIFPVGCYTRCEADSLFGPAGNASYKWQLNGTTVATTKDILATTSGSYKLIVTTSFGCVDTSGELSLTIAPKPVADAGPDVTLCTGTTQLNGTGGLVYTWSPSSFLSSTTIANPISTPTSSIDYELLVTDKNGCKDIDSVKITVSCANPLVVVNDTSICPGACANIKAIGSAGTPPYTYTWSTGETGAGTHSFCPTTTTKYIVTIYDFTGASATDTAEVIVHPVMTLTTTPTNISCANLVNGSATVLVNGGTPTYTYSWSPAGGTASTTAPILSPNTYTVKVTDAKGCTQTSTTIITEPLPITLVPSSIDANCGATDGSVSVVANGGSPVYTYLWMPGGATTATVNGLSAGTYSVTVYDSNNCSVVTNATVNNSGGVTASIQSKTDITCNGLTNGSATVTQVGGTAPYTYTWSSIGGTSDNSSNLLAGTYSITVTDLNGCMNITTVTITEPAKIVLSPTATDANCGSNNGTAAVSITSGGAGVFTYLWMPGSATTASISGLASGNYDVTVTDANGCTATTTATVNSSTGPTLITQFTNVSCFGANDGTATVYPTGGSGLYTFNWQPSGGTATTATGLTAGIYTVSVDDGACVVTSTVEITEPPQINVTTTTGDAACGGTNGSAVVTVIGGVGILTYTWMPNGGTGITENNLAAGTYTVVVADANSCTASSTAIVNNSGGLTASIQSKTDITCNGLTNGSATVTQVGGTAPYTYTWSSIGGTSDNSSNLLAGTYSITVTDLNGCIAITTVTITEPAEIILSHTTTDATCGSNNGTAAVSITSGGAGVFTYLWMPGSATTASISGLASGNYDVTVTDANGCTAFTTAIVNSSSGPTLLTQFKNVSCFGSNDGTATVNPTGGSGLYTFNWQPSGGTAATATGLTVGIYTVSVDDGACVVSSTVEITEPPQINVTTTTGDAACGGTNGSAVVTAIGGVGILTYTWMPNGGTGITENNLAAGTYTVVVADANSCAASSTAIVNNSGGLTASIQSKTDITCNGLTNGSATVTQVGGTAPYTYSWSSIGGASDNSSNLLAGTYSITVTDLNGCMNITSVVITEPAPIKINAATPIAICIGQSSVLTASANGGTPVYTFNWMPGLLTGSSISVSPTTSTTYTINVIDANGCTGLTQTVAVSVRPPLQVVATASQNSCLSDSTTLSASATGGNGNYTYTWMPINITGSTVKFKSPVGNTTYTVIVNDDCGTPSANDTVTVNISNLPTPVISSNTQSGCEFVCVKFSNAAASSGNISCYWTFGEGSTSTSCNPTNCYRTSGLYTISLTITDNMGCTASVTQKDYIKVYSSPTADFKVSPTSTTILDPVINFTDASSTDVVHWDWNFGDNYNSFSSKKNPSFTYKDTGTYEVRLVVTNAFGCVDTAIKYVLIEADYTFYVPNAFSPNGDGKNETFFPKGFMINPECYHMMIFDRWGNLIFETDDLNLGWDGRANGGKEIAQQDVYVWKIETCEYYKKRKHSYVGHVTLVK